MKRNLLSQMLRNAILLLLFFGWGAGSFVAYGATADSGRAYGVGNPVIPHEVGIKELSSISKTNELDATDRLATLPGLPQDFKPFVLDRSFEELLFGALHKFKPNQNELAQIIGKVSDLGPSKMPDLLADLKFIDAQGNAIGDDLLAFLLSADDIAVFERRLGAWDALSSTGLATDANIWLPRVSKWLDEGLEFVESGSKVIIKNGADEVGEISGSLLKVKYPYYGNDVVCHSSKTTTVVGKYELPSGEGTKKLIDSKLSKYVKAGEENPAGLNVLADTRTDIDWNNEQLVWAVVNKPWLDAAASRGDVIKAVSDPTLASNIYKPNSTDLSFFGREHEHLTKPISQGGLGYTYNLATFSYVK